MESSNLISSNMSDDRLARVDRNLTDAVPLLKEYGGDDTSLIIALLGYFSWKHQTNLFDIGTFNLDEFCEIFKYQKPHLLALHEKPRQVERLKRSKGAYERRLAALEKDRYDVENHLYVSVIENALFTLFAENIEYRKPTRYYVQNGKTMKVAELESIRILKSLKARFIETRSRFKKIVFDYTLDDSFITNMSLFFCEISLDPIAQLRRANIDELYVYLKNLKTNLKDTNKAVLNFDELCLVANIQRMEGREEKDRKKYLKQKFDKFNKIKELSFVAELSFIKGPNSRYAYTPVITFNEKAVIVRDKSEIRIDMLMHTFYKECLSAISKLHPKVYITDDNAISIIIKFLQSNNYQEEKETAYINAQVKTFGELKLNYDNAPKRVELLRSVKNEREIRLCLSSPRITTGQYNQLVRIDELVKLNSRKNNN